MNLLINLCLALFVLCSVLMVLVILMQRPKSEGLGAAFGGAVTENIFGAQTTNVLVKFTTWLAGIFFGLTLILSILYAHRSTADSAFRRELMKTQNTPQASPAPTTMAQQPGTSPTTAAQQAGASPVSAPMQASPAASTPPPAAAGASPAGSVPAAASPAATAKP